MEGVPLLRNDYRPSSPVYLIRSPEILSGDTYYFTTQSGLRYQVRFGRKRDNYLGNIINFSVLSDEFEDEYSETNRGEVYRIIATVVEIIRIFHSNHPHSDSYEFSGEYKDDETEHGPSVRTRLYYRYASRILDDRWGIRPEGNKVHIERKKN